MNDVLSQDLPDDVSTLDILGTDEPDTKGTADIIPDDSTAMDNKVEENTETNKEGTPEEENKETSTEEDTEVAKGEGDEGDKSLPDEEELTLESILGESEEVKDEVTDIADKAEEVKGTVEDVKDALQSDDTDTAEKLIDDLYGQVFNYATELDTLTTKYDMLQSKLGEMSRSNADYELQLAQSSTVSNDPKMIVLNRMYADAADGKDFAKDRVINTLEDMYYGLTGQTFEEKRIDGVSDANSEDVVLNDMTPMKENAPQEEEVDLNDISSIF